jgi:hypothetical protein
VDYRKQGRRSRAFCRAISGNWAAQSIQSIETENAELSE